MNQLTQKPSLGENCDPTPASELLPLVYEELRRLAASKLASESPRQTLQATALVHDAWMRVSRTNGPAPRTRLFCNRAHFFCAAAEAMRHILIDRARRRRCVKHGGGQERVELDDLAIAAPETDERLLEVHEVLDQFASEHPRRAEVVKLKFFVGMTDEEVADSLDVSVETVQRYWKFAKAWLLRAVLKSSR